MQDMAKEAASGDPAPKDPAKEMAAPARPAGPAPAGPGAILQTRLASPTKLPPGAAVPAPKAGVGTSGGGSVPGVNATAGTASVPDASDDVQSTATVPD